MKYLLLLFFALPLFSACQEKDESGPGIDPQALTGIWLHSFEEDSPGQQVYRPESYPFPPARGREGFEVGENGRFEYQAIAPADGYLYHEGQWELVEGNILHVQFDREDLRDLRLEILRLEADHLVVAD